jgi:hypothetical protein
MESVKKNLELEKLEHVLKLSKEIREEFIIKKYTSSISDSEIQTVLKDQYIHFSNDYPHLFMFLCSSKTNDELFKKMQETIELKRQVVQGMISDIAGKQLALSGLLEFS